MGKKFYVEYNGKIMAIYKFMKSALNYVARKGWHNDDMNSLSIFDSDGEFYEPHGGNKINFSNIK